MSTKAPASGGSGQPQRSDRAAQKRNRIVRLVVLALGLAIITVLGIAHQRGVAVVGVDALCPFGGIETLWSLLIGGAMLERIAASSVILLFVVIATALLFRRAFCGYICPLGAIQEFFGKLGGLLFRNGRPKVPAVIDRPARYLKYVVLVGFTVWTWQAATLVLRPYDPWVAYMHITSGELWAEFAVGAVVLGITVIGSIVYDRFFCKYACPMGAFLGLMSRVSLFKVRREASTCIDCGKCDAVCPVNCSVSTVDVVNDAECINCNECVNVCPVKDTLNVSAPASAGRTVLQPMAYMGIVVALIAALIGITTVAGAFAWTIPTLSDTVEKSGGAVNVEEIKGRMSFNEISQATGIPVEAFQQQFGVPADQMDVKIKDLAATYGFDVHTDVREFVTQQLEAGAK